MFCASNGKNTLTLVGQLRGACILLCKADMGLAGYFVIMLILSCARTHGACP